MPEELKPEKALPSVAQRRYVPIQVATGRGIRTVAVREDRLKSYGKLDYKGREVYARKRTVQTKSGKYVRKAVDPRKLRRNYTYEDSKRRYKKYEAKKLTRINTTRGELIVTEEQKKYTYAKKGAAYERKGAYRERVRPHRRQVSGDMLPGGYQTTITWAVRDAAGRTHTYKTFSRVSGGRLSKEEARQQNAYMLYAQLKEDGIIPGYDEQEWDANIALEPSDEEYIRYVV